MDFNTALQKLGFTPSESTVFITLTKHGPLTGYEVAKLCGISRSNVYAALYSLQEKGKCYTIESETSKYIALSKEELLKSSELEWNNVSNAIQKFFPSPIEVGDPYITIKGYENVINKIKATLYDCKSHLYILSTKEIISLFVEELSSISKTKRLTIICDQDLHIDNASIHIKKKSPSGFHMIIDTDCVITGDLDFSPQCLYTKNQSLIRVMRESFVTELDMIKLTK
ncbi:MAG: TrmB family transcriptional regulator [Cellulosilyticaceae bacterium]